MTVDVANITSGREMLRARVWTRLRRANLSGLSRDLQIPLSDLEAFGQGAGQLPEAALCALTGEFYMHARYDPAIDRLVSTAPPAQVISVATLTPVDPKTSPYYVPHDPNRLATLLLPDKDKSTPPKPRPGFAM